jgi:hypothetical protein
LFLVFGHDESSFPPLELVTYSVSFETGSHLVADFAPPGEPYLSLGEEVDLEADWGRAE